MTDLGAHILAQTVSRLEGKTTANLPIFSSFNLGTSTIVRSATCWAADLDLSCLAYLPGQTYKGYFVTRRHVILPFHITPSGTFNVLSLGTDGVVRTHSASGWTRVGTTDMSVGVLSADLPSAVNPAPILPTTYANKFFDDGVGIPVLSLEQDNKAAITTLSTLANLNTNLAGVNETIVVQPAATPLSTFYIAYRGGDSGHPAFLVVDDAVVVVMSLHALVTNGAVGPNPANHYSALNAVIDTLSPSATYRPTIADLSAFFTYEAVTTPLALESVPLNDGWTANGGGDVIAAATGTAGMTCTNTGNNITIRFETTPTGPATNANAYNFNISFTFSITETAGDLDTNIGITLLTGEAGMTAGTGFTVPGTTTDQAFSATMTLSGVTPAELADAQLVFDAYGTDSVWTIKNLALTYDYDAPLVELLDASDVRAGVDRGDGTLGTLATRRAFIARSGSTVIKSG